MASAVLVPFAAFIGLFLLYPTIVVLYKAVTPGGTLGFDALARALSGTYRTGFINSITLSFNLSIRNVECSKLSHSIFRF